MQEDFVKLHEIFPTCRATLDWKTASSKESYRHWGVGKNKPRTGMACWDVGMLSQGLRIVTVTRRLKPSNRSPMFRHIQSLRKLAWRHISSQRNDFELHWLLHRKQKTTGNILIILLRWIEVHVIFLACLFLCRYYIFIFYDSLSSWHNFGYLPAILAKPFRTPLENGTWTSSFLWGLLHTREFQRGSNLSLFQEGSWAG